MADVAIQFGPSVAFELLWRDYRREHADGSARSLARDLFDDGIPALVELVPLAHAAGAVFATTLDPLLERLDRTAAVARDDPGLNLERTERQDRVVRRLTVLASDGAFRARYETLVRTAFAELADDWHAGTLAAVEAAAADLEARITGVPELFEFLGDEHIAHMAAVRARVRRVSSTLVTPVAALRPGGHVYDREATLMSACRLPPRLRHR